MPLYSNASFLEAYNSLTDKHLVHYFSTARMRKHLLDNGLITEDGEVVPEAEYREIQNRQNQKRAFLEIIAHAIVEKSLDVERIRQAKLKRNLEDICRLHRVQRLREERLKRSEETLLSQLFGRNRRSGEKLQPIRIYSAGNMEHQRDISDTDRTRRSSTRKDSLKKNQFDSLYDALLRSQQQNFLFKRPSSCSYKNSKKQSKLLSKRSRHKSSRETGDRKEDKPVIADFYNVEEDALETKNDGSDTTTIQDGCDSRVSQDQGIVKTVRRRMSTDGKLKPTIHEEVKQTSCIVKFMYLGISRTEEAKIQQTTIDDQQKTPKGKISSVKEDNQYLSRVITVIQQPNGGNTLTVFKDSLQPGDIFQIVSRRAYGFPFSLTFYVDGTQDTRISACCEYRHRQGVRIGGRNGHFVYLTVEGSFPCFRCQTAKAMKRELKAKKLAKRSVTHRDKEEKRFGGGEKEGQREEDGEDNESDVDDNGGDSKDKEYNTLDVDINNCTNEKVTPTHRLSTSLSPPEADYMTSIIVNSLDSDSQSIIIDRIAELDSRHNKAETFLNKQTYDQHKNAGENDQLNKQLCHVDLSNIQICNEQNKFEVIQQDSLSDKCDSVTLNNTLSERSKCEEVDRSIKKDERTVQNKIHKDFNTSKISDYLHMNEFNKEVEEYADRDDENGDQSGDDDDDDTGECVDNSTGNCQPTDGKYSKVNKLTCIKNKCKEKLKSIKVVPRQKLSKWNQCMNINASSIPGDHYSQFLSTNFDRIDPEGSDTQEVTSKTNLIHYENEDDDDREESFTTVSLDKEMKTIEHRNADDLFKMNLIKQLNEIDKESIFHKTIPSSANLNLKSEQGGQEKSTSNKQLDELSRYTTDKKHFSDLFNKQASHDINSSLCSLENRIPKIVIQSPSCSNNSIECYEDTSCMSNAKQIDNDEVDIDDEMEVGDDDDDDDDISSNYDDDEKTNEGDDFNTFTYDDDEGDDDEDTSQLSVIYRPLANQSTLDQSTVHPVTTTNKPIPMNSNTYFNSLDTNSNESRNVD
ncbi:unnamed protein product [Trichobilharzia szidati]|nr:unnamed protein product [Trichobilharzia szidati]